MVNTLTSDIILEPRANGVLAFSARTGQYYGFYPYKVWAWHDDAVSTVTSRCPAANQRFYIHYAELSCAVDTQDVVERHCQLTCVQDGLTRVFLELCIAPSNTAASHNEVRRVYPGLLADAGTPITFTDTFGVTDVTGFTFIVAEIDDIRG